MALSRWGCPSVMISDHGRNFVSNETVEFVNGLVVDWRLNMPLAPWHEGFFERIVRCTDANKENIANSKTNV